jgi:hypothetical protein
MISFLFSWLLVLQKKKLTAKASKKKIPSLNSNNFKFIDLMESRLLITDDTTIFVTSSNLGLTTFICIMSRKNNSMRQVMPSTSPPHIQLKTMHTATLLSALPPLSLTLTPPLSSTPTMYSSRLS